MDAEELRVEAETRAGRARDVLERARALVAEAPFRERRWALLAIALHQAGRQAEALAALKRARAMLVDELGLDPGRELVELEEQLLRQDPALDPVLAREVSGTCPYRGLLPYDAEDADSFFGREADVAACLRKLRDSRVLAVVGPSGIGKSSLVRAGVVASLRPQRDAGPGDHSRATGRRSRCSALKARGRQTLVVDQAEEAVTAVRGRRGAGAVLRRAGRSRRRRWLAGALPAHRPPGRPGAVPRRRPARRGRPAPARPDGRARPAQRHRGPGPSRRAATGAGPGRPAGPRGRGRAGAPCRCCRTCSGRPGSAARARRSPWTATAPPAASGPPCPRPPSACTTRWTRPAQPPPNPPAAPGDAHRGRRPGAGAGTALEGRGRRRARAAGGAAGQCPPGEHRRGDPSRSPTRRWSGSGRGCAAGSTTTSTGSGCSGISPVRPTPGTRWGARRASSTEVPGSPAPWSGGSGPAPT